MKTTLKKKEMLWFLTQLKSLQSIEETLLTSGYGHVTTSYTTYTLRLNVFVDTVEEARHTLTLIVDQKTIFANIDVEKLHDEKGAFFIVSVSVNVEDCFIREI